jgi:hypothetical protein
MLKGSEMRMEWDDGVYIDDDDDGGSGVHITWGMAHPVELWGEKN